jgi:non-specific serine/threonine protein kinase
VAAELGIRDDGAVGDADGLTRRLIARLAEAPPLLVLDNCEHVLDAAAAVVRTLLQRCPDLRVLATSRQRLGLPGEVVWRVPSLPVPDPEQLPVDSDAAVAAALGFAAVRLFVERAVAVQPGFRLASGADAAAVGLICRRLDGIPLAIELAAARVTILPVAQIATRLDDRFKLLTRGTRGAMPRHQTLRALIDWSYDSLPEAEAILLRRLSVFAGGWTLEAAEAICADFGLSNFEFGLRDDSSAIENRKSEIENCDVLDLLDSLVDRSLVLVDEMDEGVRYRMLETVREYAREKLAASGELAAVRSRHRDWYVRLGEQSEAYFMSLGRSATWWARLKAELDNLRAALAWCEAAAASPTLPGAPAVGEGYPAPGGAAEAGLRLADTLYWLQLHFGYPLVDPLLSERALVRNSAAPAPLRARAFFRAVDFALIRGSSERAMSYLESAHQAYEESLTQAGTEQDRSGAARAVLGLAAVTYTMEHMEAAWSYGMEARQRMADLGDRVGLVESLDWLARIAVRRGDRQAARPLLEERLAVCRELGDSRLLIHALGGMGHLVRDEGDYARARALYQESLLHRQKEAHQIALAQSLEDFAVLAGCEQQAERAIRLLGAAEAFCETIGAIAPVADHTDYERTMTTGRAALGDAAFAAVWAEGRALSLEDAVEYARGEA